MSGAKSHDQESDFSQNKNKRRTRVRETDFSRVEGTQSEDPLHPFELEVKEKLAGSANDLITKDRQTLKLRKTAASHARLVRLVREGALTSRQRIFFDLFYVECLSVKEIASRLGVSRDTVWWVRHIISRKLRKFVLEKQAAKQKLKAGNSIRLTKKQKLIFELRYGKGLTVTQIAERLGKRPCSVWRILQRTRKIFSIGEM